MDQEQLSGVELKTLQEIEERLASFSGSVRVIARGSGLTRREIAQRMGHTSAGHVTRIIDSGAYNGTIEAVARLANALGYELHISLVPKS